MFHPQGRLPLGFSEILLIIALHLQIGQVLKLCSPWEVVVCVMQGTFTCRLLISGLKERMSGENDGHFMVISLFRRKNPSLMGLVLGVECIHGFDPGVRDGVNPYRTENELEEIIHNCAVQGVSVDYRYGALLLLMTQGDSVGRSKDRLRHKVVGVMLTFTVIPRAVHSFSEQRKRYSVGPRHVR
ncbi:hypothetical protein J6590_027131 [Homalodisca vitripennis]|nr:hypothetical protein J6590_027131 [Homalodisca vitripennis]